jgi:protease IV
MELQRSKTFSYVFIGLVAVSLLIGGGVALLKSRQTEAQALEGGASFVSGENGKKVLGALKQDHIALIRLEGAISSDAEGSGFISEESNAIAVRNALDAAAEDEKVQGVVLLINSPGGTVGMSQELNAAVKRVREKKPIVSSLLDVAASGGYYTACATDKIVTNPGALTASIGVIMQTLNMQELFNEKLGITSTTIKSGKFKDILNPYRQTRPDEVELLQTIINDSYDDFINAVLDGRLRGIKDESVREARASKIRAVADGRIVTGNQAVAVGLADELGDLQDAKRVAERLIIERNKLPEDTTFPMQEYDDNEGVFHLLGLPSFSGAVEWATNFTLLPHSQQALLQANTPFSARFANQPLWIYE